MTVIEQLAERLGVPTEVAEQQLAAFVDELQHELEASGEVTFPGVGTFRRTPTGETSFTPTRSLEAVTNHRFGGLSAVPVATGRTPVESVPPSEAPGRDDTENLAEETDVQTAGTGGPGDRSPQNGEEPLDEDVDRFWDEDRGESPLGPLPDDNYEETSYDLLEEDDREPSETGTGERGSGDDGKEDDEIEPGHEPAAPAAEDGDESKAEEPVTADSAPGDSGGTDEGTAPAPTFPRKPRSSDDGLRRKLGVVAGLLIVTGAALLLYYAWSGPSIGPSAGGSNQAAGGSGAGTDSVAENRAAPAQSGSESAAASEQPDGPSPFENPLRSQETIQPDRGGHTWIVASLADQSDAVNVRDRYAANGFRAAIFRGGNGYRVAVGQFETRQAALDTRSALPSDVASAAWVMEIESNMSPLATS